MRAASLRLRLVAGLINAAAGIGVFGAAVGAWIAGGVAYARLRSDTGEQEGDVKAGPPDLHPGVRKLLESPQLRGASTSLAVAGRNWRGLGFRVVGLRRVDARTGGPVADLPGRTVPYGSREITRASVVIC
jgi:hypothetical protein